MPKKLLITGIPGTGKTTVGDYLQDKFGYIHIDAEDRFRKESKFGLTDAHRKDKSVVITWGFPPELKAIGTINQLKQNGFKLIWFDGDREQARREFTKRENAKSDPKTRIPLRLFDLQIHNINALRVIEHIQPIQYNTFNSDHQFKDLAQIVDEIE